MVVSNTMLLGINFLALVINLALYFGFGSPVNLVCAGTSLIGVVCSLHGMRVPRMQVKLERKKV